MINQQQEHQLGMVGLGVMGHNLVLNRTDHGFVEAAAAKTDGEPSVTWLGPGSAGHFVKMVHNGIEYGVMQLLAETYDLMKRGLGLNDDELHGVYALWNESEANGYLVEITRQMKE